MLFIGMYYYVFMILGEDNFGELSYVGYLYINRQKIKNILGGLVFFGLKILNYEIQLFNIYIFDFIWDFQWYGLVGFLVYVVYV